MALQSQPQSGAVAPETIGRAVDALLKWTNSKALQQQQKTQLLEQDEFMYLVLTLKKIPSKGRTNPHKIPLPHPLHPLDASQELCLIIDDRPKSPLTSEAAKKKIQAENIPISKVLKLSKLKSDYRPFEAKRKLCSSYDLFFADKRVIPMLPRCLGKEFFKKKKIPIGVDLGRKNWKDQVQAACGSALLFLRSGTCSVVKVARIGQSRDEIVQNVRGVIDGAADIVPKKWGNIRSFHLKVSGSVALPIYQTVPEVGLKIEGVKEEEKKKTVESQGESGDEELEKKEGSRKNKKGRIHQVRYMDNKVGQEFDDIFSGKDEDDDHKSIADDALGLDSGELIGKKRKKSAKLKKKDLVDQKGEEESNILGKAEKQEATKKKKIAIDDNKDVELAVIDESSKLKERAAKKKTSYVVDGEEAAGLHVGVEKPTKLKEASKLKKHGLTKAKGGKQDADDDEEVDGTSVSLDQKKKKNKAGKADSKGIKLKTKKSKLV